MKTKSLLIIGCLVAGLAHGQINLVDTNTPHAVGGNIIVGDALPDAFTKINESLIFLNAYCQTNSGTNTALTMALQTLATNLDTLSNLWSAQMDLFPTFTNWFLADYADVKSNQTAIKFEADSSARNGTNLLDAGLSYGTSNNVPVANGAGQWSWGATPMPATMNYDAGTITSDGSGGINCVLLYAQQLKDNSYTSGSAGQIPVANGSGSWAWTTPSDIVPDSAGNGGTTLHLKASDNGADMYVHVTSAGVITASGSP
jgi:hypothetical protein